MKMGDPVDLPLPPRPPVPVPDCGTCEALAEERTRARRAGDYSRESDCNVLIRLHPHGETP